MKTYSGQVGRHCYMLATMDSTQHCKNHFVRVGAETQNLVRISQRWRASPRVWGSRQCVTVFIQFPGGGSDQRHLRGGTI